MRSCFLPFSRPSIDEADIQAVGDVLRSGWITTGPKAAAFEEAFARYCHASGAVALGSATAGMHVAMAALGIGPGDEVITPSMTWVSTVNLIVISGAKPVFVDIDRDTLMVTAERIAPLVSERTKLIVPVHFAGAAADMDPIRDLAVRAGVAIVEDAAHAAGTEYRGRKIGALGTSIFSFHPIKNLTCGEGGMVCSDDPTFLEKVRRLKFHGLGVDAYDRSVQGRSPQAEVLEPGYKYNLPDMNAALGLSQLNRLDAMIERRALLADRYRKAFTEIEEILPLRLPDYPIRHAWHLFVVRLDTEKAGMSRETFMEELKRRNIGTGIHFKAVHRQKYYRETFASPPHALVETEWNSERILSLPLFPDMTPEDVDDVVAAVKEVLG